MDVISRLNQFVVNDGRFETGKEPKYGDPFFMDSIMYDLKKKCELGDQIKAETTHGTISGVLTYLNSYGFEVMTSGKKIWNSKRNVKWVSSHEVTVPVQLVEKRKDDFDIYKINPHYAADFNPETNPDLDIDKIRKQHRDNNKEEFLNVYPDVSFEDSHVICMHRGLSFRFPFANNGISVEMYLVPGNCNNVIKIPCKVFDGCPNRYFYNACNYITKDSYKEPVSYAYLPDANKKYENVAIVCVWTVKLNDELDNLRFVYIYEAGTIEPVTDDKNICFVDDTVDPLLGYGDRLFDGDHNYILRNLMGRESVFILFPEDDMMRPIKESKRDETYGFLAMQALNHFDVKELVKNLSNEIEDIDNCPVEVTIVRDDIMKAYSSDCFVKDAPRYIWKPLKE